jgi:DNA-binding NarL/FixJ family response regulator
MPTPPKSGHRHICLVDDHPLVREQLKTLLEREPDLAVCGEAAEGPAALDLIGKQKPDLVILDISLKRSHGLELLKGIKLRHPETQVLVLSMHDEALYAERALRAGARGYITKEEAPEQVLSAVRTVLSGEIYLSHQMANRMMQKVAGGRKNPTASPAEILTDRELQVFEMIGRGMGTREIADEMRVGIKTVESYRARIKEKLLLGDANDLLRHAIQWVQHDKGI